MKQYHFLFTHEQNLWTGFNNSYYCHLETKKEVESALHPRWSFLFLSLSMNLKVRVWLLNGGDGAFLHGSIMQE